MRLLKMLLPTMDHGRLKRKSAVVIQFSFSLDFTKDKVTKPKASGRCWMLAALNTFRHKMISKLPIEDLNCSQVLSFGISMKIKLA